jgi:hypothetical protein
MSFGETESFDASALQGKLSTFSQSQLDEIARPKRGGTEGSNHVPSSGESANHQFLSVGAIVRLPLSARRKMHEAAMVNGRQLIPYLLEGAVPPAKRLMLRRNGPDGSTGQQALARGNRVCLKGSRIGRPALYMKEPCAIDAGIIFRLNLEPPPR